MNVTRLGVILTVLNVVILLAVLIVGAQVRTAVARADDQILRGRGLEIVDQQGRVRASIAIMPVDPSVTFEGRVYPETVLLRLIDPDSGPDVKLSANERGGILVLGGGSGPSYAQIGADETSAWIRLTNKDGREQVTKP